MSDWPEIEVGSVNELRDWLSHRKGNEGPYWLIHGKKSAGTRYLPYNAIVEELLAFGWIDSKPRSIDERRTAHLISPRRPKNVWSKDNRERIAKLEREGRMDEAGMRIVKEARLDGSWDALKPTEHGIAPDDLANALVEGDARSGWDAFSLSVRRRSLEFLLAAKRPETRANRIKKIVRASAEGVDPTLWKAGG